ncbi:MAG: formate dehydrogenase accessory sulfurtransferase FdhD [Gammaproteobacteria bacterium]|nr:formate dehydrogenase accessory sulfurtransferase FdhD [Gammaproteobacteria bacterium]
MVPVRRATGATLGDDRDPVAVEEPLEIRVAFEGLDGPAESLVVTMRTPGHDAELARGFLFTEGLIGSAADILDLVTAPPDAGGENVVEVRVRADLQERFRHLRRDFFTNSSCGICGKASLEALRARASYAVQGEKLQVAPSVLFGLPAALLARQPAFAATGGLHAAALFRSDGEILDVREDVGRHNALDKLIGAALAAGRLPLWNTAVLVSGRASFEIIEKARMAGCPMVVAVGAPSSLAIEAAWESDITLVGFLRGERFNIYSVPARIGAPDAG